MAGISGGTLAIAILVPLLVVAGAVGLVAFSHGLGGFGGLNDSSSTQPITYNDSHDDTYYGYGMGGMGMMDDDHDEDEYYRGSHEDECDDYMEDWYDDDMMDDDMWKYVRNATKIEGQVAMVDLDKRLLVIVDESGDEYYLRITVPLVDLSDGSIVFAPWLVAQLDTGDSVSVYAIVGPRGNGMLAGLEIGGVEYLLPPLALESLQQG